ncbi:MAG: alanine racemase [Bacteroidales bacterium]
MLKEPVVVINEAIIRSNIRTMADKASRNQLKLRPHFKTHQSAEIGEWFREQGINSCAVSSFKMAGYFAQHGWDDIMIAFPAVPALTGEYEKMAGQLKLYLFVSHPAILPFLKTIHTAVNIHIEIDTGHHRSGLDINDPAGISELVQEINKAGNLNFTGFSIHAGETYQLRNKRELEAIDQKNIRLRERLKSLYPKACISYGDTPSLSQLNRFEAVEELRPGNFVFFDIMQYLLGSCRPREIALKVACPVVAVYPEREQIIVHGGAVHLSRESVIDPTGKQIYGLVEDPEKDNTFLENTVVESLAQEHGVIKTTRDNMAKFSVGESLSIFPVHSCLTADMASSYLEDQTGRIISKMQH